MIKSLQGYIKPYEDPKDQMLNVRIPLSLAQELKDIARHEGRKLSDIHRAALEKIAEEARAKKKENETCSLKKTGRDHLPREFPVGYQFPMFDRF